jgi:sigma-B regulation protein RsbU (phosphoserine phosphatase)
MENSKKRNVDIALEDTQVFSPAMYSMSREELLDYIESQYGKYLGKLFLDQWIIANIEEVNLELENEHGKSLALLFEIESQKLAMRELNNKLTDAAEIQKKDLLLAAQVQSNLLFKVPPAVKDYDISFYYEPCSSVSGDFYDFYTETSDQFLSGLVLADVSGHGISSSLLTVLSKPIFYRMFHKNRNKPLDEVLEKTNKQIIKEVHDSGNYLTCILLRIDKNHIEYINAAHPDILIKRASENTVHWGFKKGEELQGTMLGIGDVQLYGEPVSIVLDKGDFVVVYTDCLIESRNRKDVLFSDEDLKSVVHALPNNISAEEACRAIVDSLKIHMETTPLNDDLSVIVIKKN